jgi:hypothetical protein
MKSIYKYTLRATDEQVVELPYGARILSVANQRENMCLWALVNTEQARTERRIIVIKGTGHSAEDIMSNDIFLGTVLLHNGDLVFHVFEGVTHNAPKR